ncbi:unnamed protein product [Parajaminaea phylloscopi]
MEILQPTMASTPTSSQHSQPPSVLAQRRRPVASPVPPPFGFYDPLHRDLPAQPQERPRLVIERANDGDDNDDDDRVEILAPAPSYQPPGLVSVSPSLRGLGAPDWASAGRTLEQTYTQQQNPSDLSLPSRRATEDFLSVRPSYFKPRPSGDDLPGAKARKILGIGAEGGWDDDDDDDEEDHTVGRHRQSEDSFRPRHGDGSRQKRLSLSTFSNIGRAAFASSRPGSSDDLEGSRSSLFSMRSVQRVDSSHSLATLSSTSSSLGYRCATREPSSKTSHYSPAPEFAPLELSALTTRTSFQGPSSHDRMLTPASGRPDKGHRHSGDSSATSPVTWVAPSNWAITPVDSKSNSRRPTPSPSLRTKGFEQCALGAKKLVKSASRLDAYVKKLAIHRPSSLASGGHYGDDEKPRDCFADSRSPMTRHDHLLWEKDLEGSQKEAAWQTMVEHRPRRRRSASSTTSSSWSSSTGCGGPYAEHHPLQGTFSSHKESWREGFGHEANAPYPFGPSPHLGLCQGGDITGDESYEELDETTLGEQSRPSLPRSKSLGEAIQIGSQALPEQFHHARMHSENAGRTFGISCNTSSNAAITERESKSLAPPLRRPALAPQAPSQRQDICPASETSGYELSRQASMLRNSADSLDASPCPSLTRSPTASESFTTTPPRGPSFLPRLSLDRDAPGTPSSQDLREEDLFAVGQKAPTRPIDLLGSPCSLNCEHSVQPSHRPVTLSTHEDASQQPAPGGLGIDFQGSSIARNLMQEIDHEIRRGRPMESSDFSHCAPNFSDADPQDDNAPFGDAVRVRSWRPSSLHHRRGSRPDSMLFPEDAEEDHAFAAGGAGSDCGGCVSDTSADRANIQRQFQRLEICDEYDEGVEEELDPATGKPLAPEGGLLIILPPTASFRPQRPRTRPCPLLPS